MKPEREKALLELLARVPPQGCRCYFRPVPTLMKELAASRDELSELVGKQAAGYAISAERGDHLRFDRLPQSSAAPPVSASSPTTPSFVAGAAAAFGPQAVGKAAQRYADSEFAMGREVSATEAVAHIMAQQAKTKAQIAPRPAPKDYALAARVLTGLIELDRRKHNY